MKSELGEKIQRAMDKSGCRHPIRKIRWLKKSGGYTDDTGLFYSTGKPTEFKNRKKTK